MSILDDIADKMKMGKSKSEPPIGGSITILSKKSEGSDDSQKEALKEVAENLIKGVQEGDADKVADALLMASKVCESCADDEM